MDISDRLTLLDSNTADTLEFVKRFSSAQLSLKKQDGWTILEILEHIVIVEGGCYKLLTKSSENVAETPEIFGQEKLNKLLIERRERKVVAPEGLHPKGEIKDVASFEKTFLEQRNLFKQNINSNKIIVDNRTHKHPFLGEMTISDWVHFIPMHTKRHVEQIKDVLAENK
jgi:hypothetical protein